MQFDKLYKMLIEGGKMFDSTSRINLKDIEPTLVSFSKQVLTPLKLANRGSNWDVLGSTGKKDSSGDIDIAVVNADLDKIESYAKRLKLETRKIGDILSIKYPIANSKEFIQIDLVKSNKLDYTKFAYGAPGKNETAYESGGIYRTELLKSIASQIKNEVTATFDDGTPKELTSVKLSPNVGLVNAKDSYVSPKTGNKLARPEKISRDIITNDVTKIIQTLLGPKATAKDVVSFETIWNFMKSPNFLYKDRIDAIKKNFVEKLNEKNVTNKKYNRPLLAIPEFK